MINMMGCVLATLDIKKVLPASSWENLNIDEKDCVRNIFRMKLHKKAFKKLFKYATDDGLRSDDRVTKVT